MPSRTGRYALTFVVLVEAAAAYGLGPARSRAAKGPPYHLLRS